MCTAIIIIISFYQKITSISAVLYNYNSHRYEEEEGREKGRKEGSGERNGENGGKRSEVGREIVGKEKEEM